MKNISVSRGTRFLRGAALLLCLLGTGAAQAEENDGVSLDERKVDPTIYSCILGCDQSHVDYSKDLVGPGADYSGAQNMARRRYALCLYHCDPRLALHGTLMRLFPPVGKLAATKRSAMTTAEQLQLCRQDCEISKGLCMEAQFENVDLCRGGAKACSARCESAFGAGDEPEPAP